MQMEFISDIGGKYYDELDKSLLHSQIRIRDFSRNFGFSRIYIILILQNK